LIAIIDVMPDKEKLKRYSSNIRSEKDSAALYRVLAESESSKPLAEVYRNLATVEDKHARFWEDRVRAEGGTPEKWKPGLRMRIMRWLAKRIGPQVVVPLVAAAEKADRGVYDNQPESKNTSLPRDERSHTRVLSAIIEANPAGMEGSSLARLEGRHRVIGGNALRAAVLGANDGLVSNLSLVMGVAGANLSPHTVLITGFAGLLAGAISMAIGEWISVQSSRELSSRQIQVESDELAAAPEEEEEELALIYQAKGLPREEAEKLAHHLIQDKDKALDTLAREELGIDPKELGGSALEAALMSFGLFALGAIIPVIPFLITSGYVAVLASVGFSTLALFGIGAAITLVTSQPLLKAGMRQIIFGLLAAGVTFGIGHLVGVHLGG